MFLRKFATPVPLRKAFKWRSKLQYNVVAIHEEHICATVYVRTYSEEANAKKRHIYLFFAPFSIGCPFRNSALQRRRESREAPPTTVADSPLLSPAIVCVGPKGGTTREEEERERTPSVRPSLLIFFNLRVFFVHAAAAAAAAAIALLDLSLSQSAGDWQPA